MILRGLVRGAGGVLLAGLLVSAAGATPRMDVRLTFGELATGELRVTMDLRGFDEGALRLRGVPAWIDNPMAEPRGELVRELLVSDGAGRELAARFSRDEAGEPGWTVETTGEIHVSYRLLVDYRPGEMVDSYPILVPFMDSERAWLLGNHVFLAPDVGAGARGLLADLPVNLSIDIPPDAVLVGPPAEVELRNLFELLSLQFGVGEFTVVGGKSSVAFMDLADFSKAERELLAEALADQVEGTARLFGGMPTPWIQVLVMRGEGTGGLEGAWAAHAWAPAVADLSELRQKETRSFYGVLAHEVVHSWLPVALFALDDPWVKEGFTSWYGFIVAARGGWIGPADVDRLFADYDQAVQGEVGLEDVPLSDPRIWFEEYSGESWRRLTYDRGSAVTLLLDVFLREKSGGERSLDDVLPVLFARHAKGGFDRAQFLSAIEVATGVDAAGFFAEWVDSTRVPARAEVDAAMRKAIAMGAFAKD